MAQLQPSYRSLNPLHYAVRENDIESVKRYLEERNDPEDIHNALTKYDAQTGGKTPLYYACRYGHGKSVSAELFKFLLEKSTLEVLKFRPSDSDEDDNYNNDEPINVLEVLCQEFKQVSTKDITMRKIELASQRWIELDPNVNHFPDSTTLGIISLANLYSQKVKRKLLIEGGSLMKTMMNKMFVSSSNMALLMHYLYIHILIIFSYSYLLHESILHSTEKNSYDETALAILITCTISRIVRMLIQVTGPSLDVYVKDPFNLIDLLQIFFLIVNIRLLFLFTSKGDSHDLGEESFRSLSPFERYSIILSTGISWIQLLFISGKFIYSISVFTTALLRIFKVLVPFIITTCAFIAFYSNIYTMWIITDPDNVCNIESENEDEETQKQWCHFGQAFKISLTMFLSAEWKYEEEETHSWFMSFMYSVIGGLILLSIVIAVITDAFSQVVENGREVFWCDRARFLTEKNTMIWWNCYAQFAKNHFPTCCHYSKVESKGHDEDKIGRISFRTYSPGVEDRGNEEGVKEFLRWWFHTIIDAENRDTSDILTTPSFNNRIYYFFTYAHLREIILPNEAFENILVGQKYDYSDLSGIRFFFARICSFLLFLLSIIGSIVVFCLGLVSFGLLWPVGMKELIFYGPTEDEYSNESMEESMKKEEGELKESLVKEMSLMKESQRDQMKRFENSHQEQVERLEEVIRKLYEQKEHMN